MPLPRGTGATLALGALVVGTLDILDAFVFGAIRGVHPPRVLQGIASGLLGRSSFEGGFATAALGLAIHFFIATTVVLVYYGAARAIPALRRSPLLWGPIYGVGVFLFMYLVVIPSSAIGPRPIRVPVAVNGVLIHILAVGIPAALTARAALGPKPVVRPVP